MLDNVTLTASECCQ